MVNKSNLDKIQRFIADPIAKVVNAQSRREYNVDWHTGGIPTDVSKQSQVKHE